MQVKDKKKTDGGKAELAIGQETKSIVQIKTYNEKGVQTSNSKLNDFKPVDGSKGKFQPRIIHTENLEKKQKIELQVLQISALTNPQKEDFLIKNKAAATENN